MGPVKNFVTCIMPLLFTPFNFLALSQFYSTTFPVFFTKLHSETTERELHIWLLQCITLYQRR